MTTYPWQELKFLEEQMMDLLVQGSVPTDDAIVAFRATFEICSSAPDAEEAICYHGSKSLIFQLEGNLAETIRHRNIETKLIQRAYELEKENPTGGWSLQNYGESDIQKRTVLMNYLTKST